MHFLFSPDISNDIVLLTDDEAKHAIILRLKPDERVTITDGKGNTALGIIRTDIKRKIVEFVIEERNFHPKPESIMHIAIAPTKSNENYEWFLEKATELGVLEITPLTTHYSEKKQVNIVRYEKIILSAMKQSGRAWKPTFNPIETFEKFIETHAELSNKFIANSSGVYFETEVEKNQSILILIGPEGDFSDHELAMAMNHGFKNISFGHFRLRTETAGLFAAAHFASNLK